MGIPPFMARWKAPFLNGNRSGTSSLCRVPSANMNNDVRRAFMPSPAASSDRCAFALFPLSTKTVPDKFINSPNTGFHFMDFFAMIDACLGNILKTGNTSQLVVLVRRSATLGAHWDVYPTFTTVCID